MLYCCGAPEFPKFNTTKSTTIPALFIPSTPFEGEPTITSNNNTLQQNPRVEPVSSKFVSIGGSRAAFCCVCSTYFSKTTTILATTESPTPMQAYSTIAMNLLHE
jgi:hypothetical protein